jgi:hypothetical protein
MIHHSFLSILGFSLLGSFITTFSFAASSTGKLQIATLFLPAVAQVASIAGIGFGIFLSPLMYWCLKDKKLKVVLPIMYSFAFVCTTALSLIHPKVGFLGAFFFWVLILLLMKYYAPVTA